MVEVVDLELKSLVGRQLVMWGRPSGLCAKDFSRLNVRETRLVLFSTPHRLT
jgi:hypothetical protein